LAIGGTEVFVHLQNRDELDDPTEISDPAYQNHNSHLAQPQFLDQPDGDGEWNLVAVLYRQVSWLILSFKVKSLKIHYCEIRQKLINSPD
jgi:hypothetical protein